MVGDSGRSSNPNYLEPGYSSGSIHAFLNLVSWSLVRPSNKACSSDATSNRRPSLSDGAPAWTPKQLTETGTGESREFRRDKRESLAGGLPPWAPTQQQEKAPVLADAAAATRRRSSLGGGMPPWAPAPAVATEAFSRLSLDGDISPWTPKSFAGSVGKTGSPSTYYEDARQGGYSSEKQQAQQLALPDWLTTAACGSSTKVTSGTALISHG